MTYLKLRNIVIFILTVILIGCQSQNIDQPITGYIEAEIRIISAPQSGWITEQNVTEGDIIDENQLLFQLDQVSQLALTEQARQNLLAVESTLVDLQKGARPEEIKVLESQLMESKARFQLAQKELNRIQSLVTKGLLNSEQLDQAKTDLEVTQAQVSSIMNNINVAKLSAREDTLVKTEAQVRASAAQFESQKYQLSQRSVRSNLDGLINEIFYHTGEFVPAGSPVLAIRLTNQDKVRFHIPQAEVHKLKLGQQIKIQGDGLKSVIPAHITYISSTAEFTPPVIYSNESRAKLVFMIEAQLKPGYNLTPGLPVNVIL